MFKVPEDYRLKEGTFGSDPSFGNNGIFMVPLNHGTIQALCLASDRKNWEHVSVSLRVKNRVIKRCPTWEEMCQIKSIFWSDNDCVVQYHPSKDNYINNHEYCLHLWRPLNSAIPVPPSILVGIK